MTARYSIEVNDESDAVDANGRLIHRGYNYEEEPASSGRAKYTVDVVQADIDAAQAWRDSQPDKVSYTKCPVAQCLRRHFPGAVVTAAPDHLTVGADGLMRDYSTTPAMRKWMAAWDRQEPVVPTTFDVVTTLSFG